MIRIPTNPHLVPVTAQRMLAALDACVIACQKPGDQFNRPADGKRRSRKAYVPWEVLGELGLIERYGSGWRPTKSGLEAHAFSSNRWGVA